jgi:hypothetical protein
MLFMDFIAEIRRRHFVSDEDISSIARSLNQSRTTVRKHLLTTEEPIYQRKIQTFPKLGDFQERLKQWLEIDYRLPKNNEEPHNDCLNAYRQKVIGAPMKVCNVMCKTIILSRVWTNRVY